MNLCHNIMTMTPCSTMNYFDPQTTTASYCDDNDILSSSLMSSKTMTPQPPLPPPLPPPPKQENESSSSEDDESKKKKSSNTKTKTKNKRRKSDRRNRAGSETQFPGKLHDMLEWIHLQNLTHIISWVGDQGQAFIIHDPSRLTDILPLFFGQTLYRSFRRQLNMWHFQRMPSGHQNQGAFVHPLFVRGQKMLCSYMSRHVNPNEYVKLLEPEPLPTTLTSSTSPSSCNSNNTNAAILQPDDSKELQSHYDIAELFGSGGGGQMKIERNTPSPVKLMVGSDEKTSLEFSNATAIGSTTFDDCKDPFYGTEDIALTTTTSEVSSSSDIMMPSSTKQLLFDHNNTNNNMVPGGSSATTTINHQQVQGQLKTEEGLLSVRPDTATATSTSWEDDGLLFPGFSTPASPESIEFLFMEGL